MKLQEKARGRMTTPVKAMLCLLSLLLIGQGWGLALAGNAVGVKEGGWLKALSDGQRVYAETEPEEPEEEPSPAFTPFVDTFEEAGVLPAGWSVSLPPSDPGTAVEVSGGKLRVTNAGTGKQVALTRAVGTGSLSGMVKFSYTVKVLQNSRYNLCMPAIYSSAGAFDAVSQVLMVEDDMIVSNAGPDVRPSFDVTTGHTYAIAYVMDFDSEQFSIRIDDVTSGQRFELNGLGFKTPGIDTIHRLAFWIGSTVGHPGEYELDDVSLAPYVPEPEPELVPIHDTFDTAGTLPDGWSVSLPTGDPGTSVEVTDGQLWVTNAGTGKQATLSRAVNSAPLSGKVRVAYRLEVEANSRYNLSMPALYSNAAAYEAASQLLLVGDGMTASTGSGDVRASIDVTEGHRYEIEYILDYDARTFDLSIADLTDGAQFTRSGAPFKFAGADRLQTLAFWLGSEVGHPGRYGIDELIVEPYADTVEVPIDPYTDVLGRIADAYVFAEGSPIVYAEGERTVLEDASELPRTVSGERQLPASFFPSAGWTEPLIPVSELEDQDWTVQSLADGLTVVSSATTPVFAAAGEEALLERTQRLFGLFVATDGDDDATGVYADPLRTMDAARSRLAAIKQADGLPVGGMHVYLRGGDYRLQQSVRFGRDDSGSAEAPIVYASYPGERAHLTGSLPLDGASGSAVTDPDVLDRLPQAAASLVVAYDLPAAGIHAFGQIRPANSFTAGTYSHPELFIDGRRQVLARWPNTGFVNTGTVLEKDETSTTFRFPDERLQAWETADDVWLQGFWTWDWYADSLRVLELDSEAGTLTTNNPTYGISGGKRFYAFNLLEELDSPGEWYLDRTSGILYVYPAYPLDQAKLRWSSMTAPILSITRTEHVAFERLVLEESRGSGIQMNQPVHIRVAGAIIRNLGQQGVVIEGGQNSGIVDSDIYEINKGGVRLGGGDAATLTPAGNYVENSHLYRTSQAIRTNIQPIKIDGVGNRVSNNMLHDVPHDAIGFEGNEHLIENNEFFNVLQETGDAGAIYTGASWSYYNNLITGNLFHDIRGPGADDTYSVYLDDYTSGTRVVGNLFYNVAKPVFINGGRDNQVTGNVILNSRGSIKGSDRSNDNANLPTLVPYQRLLKVPYTTGIWASSYPLLPNILSDNPTYPKYNTITGNRLYDSGGLEVDSAYATYGTVSDNTSTATAPIFASPLELHGLHGLDVGAMGLRQTGLRSELALVGGFRATYPLDGATEVQGNRLRLSWVDAHGADAYRVIVADNPQLTSPVIDEVVQGNSYLARNLAYGETTYYWQVEARSGSALHPTSVLADDGVRSFTTSATETVDDAALLVLLTQAQTLHDGAVEGSGEGEYAAGAKALLLTVIEDAEDRLASPSLTQDLVDEAVDALREAMADFRKRINVQLLPLTDVIADVDNWLTADRSKLEPSVDASELTFTGTPGGSIVAGYKYPFRNHQLLRFDATFSLSGGWQGLGFRAATADAVGWSGSSYLITVASGQLELIRFGAEGATLLTIPNSALVSDQRAELELGALDTPSGVRLLLRVDGVTVIDYLDTSAHAITEEGMLVLYDAGGNGITVHAPQ